MTSTLAILGRFSGDKAKALAYCDDLIATYSQCREELRDAEPRKQVQTSGPQCKNCNAFTTYKRVNTHGLCMKCEGESHDDRKASVTDADYRWQ